MFQKRLMRTKALAVALAVTMLLGACGNSGEVKNTEGTQSTQETQSAEETQKTEETQSAEVIQKEDIISKINEEIAGITAPVEADVFVKKVEGLDEDFIRGVDVSTLLVQEESGVVYYDEEGNEADLMKVLANAGVNYIRVRVWNDPYNEEGKGYGGGNNDIEKAIEIGKRATAYGMKVLVDFHYSDFWADPKKQMCPKAWEGMSVEEKTKALGDYTYDCVKQLYDAGVDLGMVQIGNETDNGMAGETVWTNMLSLFEAGCDNARKASKEANKDLLIAVHFSNPAKGSYPGIAQKLKDKEIDYDVFSTSYYTYWHEGMENLTTTMKNIADTYGKKVMVAETAYPFTLEDSDQSGNSIGNVDELIDGYTASVQGQANVVRDVAQAVKDMGDAGIGFFYWEPAWITVNPEGTKEENEKIWEEKGSGWASRFAAKYDPVDAGQYYGGSSWDNQAMFDTKGHPLPSLDVYKYIYTGATCEKAFYDVEATQVEMTVGSDAKMPETVQAIYNDGSVQEEKVTWNMDEVNAAMESGFGTYTIHGTVDANGEEVTAVLNITSVNLLANPSFEDADVTMWKVINNTSGESFWFDGETPKTGSKCGHFWSESPIDFKLEQTVTGLENGKYNFNVNIQGGDMGDAAEIKAYAIVNGEEVAVNTAVDGWKNWKLPQLENLEVTNGEITVGISVKGAAKGWGTIDDACLYPAQ